jgi:hypothetical protein
MLVTVVLKGSPFISAIWRKLFAPRWSPVKVFRSIHPSSPHPVKMVATMHTLIQL